MDRIRVLRNDHVNIVRTKLTERKIVSSRHNQNYGEKKNKQDDKQEAKPFALVFF